MDSKDQHIIRFKELSPDFVQVEERTLADYLIYLKELAKQVVFVQPDMKIQGDWSVFFENNLTVFLAGIADYPLDKKKSVFEAEFNKLKETNDKEKLVAIFSNLLRESSELIKTLNDWYVSAFRVQLTDDNNIVGLSIRRLVRKDLLKPFSELFWIQKRFQAQFEDLGVNFTLVENELDGLWELDPEIIERFEKLPFLEKEEKLKDDLLFLSKIVNKGHKDFAGTLSFLIAQAPKLLEDSLISHADHSPEFAVLISFLKLYEHVKGDLNQITQKHLDYYYRDVLGENNLTAKSDRGFVWFTLSEHINNYHLERGTRLTAGQDEEGLDYVYYTKQDLDISHAELTDVKVVFVAKNLEIGEENSFREVSHIFKSEIKGEEGENPFLELKEDNIFSTFGEEQYNYTPGNQTMEPAHIGFAISSPLLLLSEGERELTFKFKFNLKSLSPLVSFLEKFSKKQGLDAETGFIKLFSKVFDIKLSGSEDWLSVEKYRIYPDKDWTKGVFYIRFTLDVTSPAVVGPNEETPYFQEFESKWPVAKFILTDAESMYAYSYVKDLVIDECEIAVEVKKVRGVNVYNDLGQLDISNPFMPFGPSPGLGSYMMIGHGELFKKKLTDLTFDIQWHNLPREDEGFSEYFKMYSNPSRTEEFQVALSALSEFDFYPQDVERRQSFELYKPTDPDANPANNKVFDSIQLKNIDLKLLNLERDLDTEELPEFDGTTKAGYFKLELSAPEDPFGHSEYPDLFAQAVIKNSKSKKEEILPASPYIPEARGLTLSYKAQTKIVLNYTRTRENDGLSKEKFFHLTPFGLKTTLQNTIPSDNHLLPQFDANGYLQLGLENVVPGEEVSLYFMMRQNVSNQFDIKLPQLKWRYLVGDDWLVLDEKHVISDSTDGFTTSGILKIKVPLDINETHHILPSGKCWLEVSVDGDASVLSKTLAIYTQAIEVEWEGNTEVEWRGHNEPGSINAFLEGKSEIEAVYQPEATFSGRAKESDEEFYSRIASRIKHKNRAITARDIELMVEDWYSDLGLIKCIPAQDGLKEVPVGQSVIIVVPEIKPSKHFYLPKFSYSRLNEIEKRLNQLTSSFSSFKVVNPVYEQFLITARLKFIDERNSGDYIRKLHEDLIAKICPWFYDRSKEIALGVPVKRDEVISFIESREYVRFVTKVSIVAVTQDANGGYVLRDTANQEELLKTVEATSPWSVLVPVANHNFEIIEEMIHESPEKAAIETMRLEGDFVIMGDDEEDEVEFASAKDHQTYVVEINFEDK